MIQSRTVDAGPVAVRPMGAYDSNYDYELLMEVQDDHDSFISLSMHNKGHKPSTSPAYWFRSTNGGKAAYDQAQATAAVTTETERVNIEISGMTVTITNRSGQSTSVNIGFEIYRTYASVAAMNADAANVPDGKFVMIATEDPTSAENARLYGKNSQGGFTFLSDLDQASSSAWADWLNNMKPLIEADHQTAEGDHITAVANSAQAGLDHTTALGDTQQAARDHTDSVNATQAATEKAALANEKATLADEKATAANNAATLANEKASLADEKATAANTAAELANSKAGLADSAATLANEKAALANEKASLADTKAGLADTAAAYANEQGDYAKNLADHPAYIADGTEEKPGDVNFWYIWDFDEQMYVKDAYAKGDNLSYDDMTPEEKQDLIDNIKADLVFASNQTCEDIISELT